MNLWTFGGPVLAAISAYGIAAFDGRMYSFEAGTGRPIAQRYINLSPGGYLATASSHANERPILGRR